MVTWFEPVAAMEDTRENTAGEEPPGEGVVVRWGVDNESAGGTGGGPGGAGPAARRGGGGLGGAGPHAPASSAIAKTSASAVLVRTRSLPSCPIVAPVPSATHLVPCMVEHVEHGILAHVADP